MDDEHKIIAYYDKVENCSDFNPNSDELCVNFNLRLMKNVPVKKKLDRLIDQADSIVLHQLNSKLVLHLCSKQRWRKKTRVVCWGGDIEELKPRKNDKIVDELKHLKRKLTCMMGLTMFHSAGFLIDTDKEWVVNCVNHVSSPKIVQYTTFKFGDNDIYFTNQKPQRPYCIQLGNSGDPSNLHIDTIYQLLPYKDEDFRLYVPLSYGGTKEYIENVISCGKKLLGDKFVPMTEFIDYGEYVKFLDSMTVSIQNQPRQQALGNIHILLQFKSKVYLNPLSPSFKYFQRDGFSVFSSDEIGKIPFDEFVSTDRLQINRKLILDKDLLFDNRIGDWKNFIYD